MKLFRLLFLALFASCALARADLTIVQKVDGQDGTSNVVLKIKGDMARVEINPKITTILNAKTGELVTLMNEQKTVLRISGEKAKAMAEMAGSMAKDKGLNQPPKATGKTEKINGYETEEYVSDSPNVQTTYWVAKDYPNYKSILAQLSVLQKGAFAAIRRGVPDYSDLPGMTLRTVIKMGDKNAVTSTLVSLNSDPIPDSAFTVPTDYAEIKMPDFLDKKSSPGEPEKSDHK